MSRYDIRYYAKICCGGFDADRYLTALAEKLRERLAGEGHSLSALTASGKGPDGQISRVEWTAAEGGFSLRRSLKARCVDLPVELSVESDGPGADLERLTDQAIGETAPRFRLSVTVFSKNVTGDGEQTRRRTV